MMTQPALTIQEAAERTGLSTHTLRYYERIGLLQPVERAASGHRRYTEADLRRIGFLNRLRATGMSIRAMCAFAALYADGDASLGRRRVLLQAHREKVLERIAALQDNLAVIEYKIALYAEQEAEYTVNCVPES